MAQLETLWQDEGSWYRQDLPGGSAGASLQKLSSVVVNRPLLDVGWRTDAEGLVEMGSVWGVVPASQRARSYQVVDAVWSGLHWRIGRNPYILGVDWTVSGQTASPGRSASLGSWLGSSANDPFGRRRMFMVAYLAHVRWVLETYNEVARLEGEYRWGLPQFIYDQLAGAGALPLVDADEPGGGTSSSLDDGVLGQARAVQALVQGGLTTESALQAVGLSGTAAAAPTVAETELERARVFKLLVDGGATVASAASEAGVVVTPVADPAAPSASGVSELDQARTFKLLVDGGASLSSAALEAGLTISAAPTVSPVAEPESNLEKARVFALLIDGGASLSSAAMAAGLTITAAAVPTAPERPAVSQLYPS